MSKKGVISVGINLEYQKTLNEMVNSFEIKISQIQNNMGKVSFSKDLTQQIDAIRKELGVVQKDMSNTFAQMGNQKLDVSAFEDFQKNISGQFDQIGKQITSLNGSLSLLGEQFQALNGADAASGIVSQFNDLKSSISESYTVLKQVLNLCNSSTLSSTQNLVELDGAKANEYKATLSEILKVQREIDNMSFASYSDDSLFEQLSKEEDLLKKQISLQEELSSEKSRLSFDDADYSKKETEIVKFQLATQKTAETIQLLDLEIANRNLGAGMEDDTATLISSIGKFETEIDNFTGKAKTFIKATREMQDSAAQTSTAFNTFQIKNGSIHVPVEIATRDTTLENSLKDLVDRLQSQATKNPIITAVKLQLDKSTSSEYKKNSDIEKQLQNNSDTPPINIDAALKNTYIQAVRAAEATAKESIKTIQAIFKDNPMSIEMDKEKFLSELSGTVNNALSEIAKGTGLNVTDNLTELVGSLKELTTTLSSTGTFTFGIDEQVINRITQAIEEMSSAIQRAFSIDGTAKLSGAWSEIETKFKSIANENGRISNTSKTNKQGLTEIAKLYQDYYDTGGKHSLNELTENAATVKNLNNYWTEVNQTVHEVVSATEMMRNGIDVTDTPPLPTQHSDNKKNLTDVPVENVDSKKLEELTTQLEKLKANAEGSWTQNLKNLGDILNNLKIENKTSEKLTDLAIAIQLIREELDKTTEKGSGFLSEINSLVSQAEKLKDISNVFNTTKQRQIGTTNAKESVPDNKSDAELAKIKDYASKVDTALKTQTYLFDNTLLGKSDGFKSALADIQNKVNEINAVGLLEDGSGIEKAKELKSTVETMMSNLKKDYKPLKDVTKEKLSNKIVEWEHKNTAAAKAFSEELDALKAKLNALDNNVDVSSLEADFLRLKTSAADAGKTGLSFFDQWKNRMKSLAVYLSSFASFYDIINILRQGINTIKELDTAMVEVRKVSNESEASYASFADTMSQTAKRIASTNKELRNSAADYLRLGQSIDQAGTLAENTAIYVNVGDGIDINTATSDMITAMKAFDIGAENSMKIVDSYNQIGNKFAISSVGIGEAMRRSASALEAGNNSFEESIALVTAMNEIVQNTENTGNTLKVLSLRLRGASADLEEMGEDTDGLISSTSKLQEKILALSGVDIMIDKNNFKSTTDIMRELGAAWGNMEDVSQAALLEIIAGKTRANNVKALLKNYEQIDNVLASLSDAEGSALKENEAIVDSISGRIEILKAQSEEFWLSFESNDFVKNIVTAFTQALDLATQLNKTLGTLPTLATLIAPLLGAKGLGLT